MDARALTTLSLAGRAAFGVGSYLAPDSTWRGFGVRVPAGNSRYLGRMFGVRDVALGAAALMATGEARRALLKVLVVADVLDAGAALAATKQKDVGAYGSAVLLLGGLAFLAGDLAELVAGESD